MTIFAEITENEFIKSEAPPVESDNLINYSPVLCARVVYTSHCLFHFLGKDNLQLQMSCDTEDISVPRYQYNLTRKSVVILT